MLHGRRALLSSGSISGQIFAAAPFLGWTERSRKHCVVRSISSSTTVGLGSPRETSLLCSVICVTVFNGRGAYSVFVERAKIMIDRCANPHCQSNSAPLGDGKLYSLDRRGHNTEFFWLCGECSKSLIPSLDSTGQICVIHKSDRPVRMPPHLEYDLRVVAHLGDHTCWHFHREPQKAGQYARALGPASRRAS